MNWKLVRDALSAELVLAAAIPTGTSEWPHSIASSANLRLIAVVDRTADVQTAAKQILYAHLAFSGRSPHAPDLIVVNEWIKNNFIDTTIRGRSSIDRHDPNEHDDQEWKKALKEAESKGEAKLIKAGGLDMVDVHDSPEYLVAYHFADPAAGKFLSQQISSHWSFVNHIPVENLGKHPSFTHNLQTPANDSSTDFSFNKASVIGVEDLSNPKSKLLRQREIQPLRETGQGPGTAIGFFEQGIIVGALFIFLPVVSVVGYSGWVLSRKAFMGFVGGGFGF
ncbi:hypothetical protein BO71DRAFT_479024 [Aspergillus ellipticus CBS 707.79]|uniref:Uncharacterized protein n=1 Tax=Aspergillus ellipticus CBS 707.79 TaxID=1448320 RepID=A0A319DQF5_9EURO|nr:hypothetical protein BO71DRAFT_479024 [Aspergillus ellipticus CBS 707.79]